MKMHRIMCMAVITLSLWAVMATAEVPHYINFQGTLTDTSGNPITGIRSIQFFIYSDSTSPIPLWNESQPSVDITDGLFRVSLGSVTPLPPTLFNGSTRWLGIRVSPDLAELSPGNALPAFLMGLGRYTLIRHSMPTLPPLTTTGPYPAAISIAL